MNSEPIISHRAAISVPLMSVLSAVCLGTLFPLYEIQFPPFNELNLFWGTLFGFAWWVAVSLHASRLLEGLLGFLLWPSVVTFSIYRAAAFMTKSNLRLCIWTVLMAVTLLASVPAPNFMDHSLASILPTFQRFISSAY